MCYRQVCVKKLTASEKTDLAKFFRNSANIRNEVVGWVA